MNTIYDFFPEKVEYPDNVIGDILPYGVLWSYISCTFLNGFVNYVKPIGCFVVDRYCHPDTDFSDLNIQYHLPNEFGIYKSFIGTKKQLIVGAAQGKFNFVHTRLSLFRDDFILIGKMPDEKNGYVFFWFDMDVSDCQMGRFKSDKGDEFIINSVENLLKKMVMENPGKKPEENLHNDVCQYYKLPVSFIEGWNSF